MTSSCIPFTRVPKATPLFLDYLYHYSRVERFYGGSPQEFASFQNVAQAIGDHYPDRDQLAGMLEQQNRGFGCGEATLENIRRLKSQDTFAVVAGQQVGLFSGPAFTLYKALTAIRVAESLTEQGLKCVPVFWLASEDHDLEEVAKTAVLDEEGKLVSLSVPGERPAPASSVGYAKLAGEVAGEIERIGQALPESDARGRLLEDLRECYAPGVSWSDAFGRFMTRLFSRFGVVLIDPLHETCHRITEAIYKKALEDAPRLRSAIEMRSRELMGAGYHAQVHAGPESTLLFATAGGSRTPVSFREGQFHLDGSPPLAIEEMAARLKSSPLDFTPSALLRPVVQDTLLPTVAYIPGPAELAYFAQSQAIYPEFGRPIPVLFLRAGFTLADRHQERLMEKYHLGLDDVWQGADHLRRRIATTVTEGNDAGNWSARMDRGEEELKRVLEQLAPDVERIDPTLLDAVRNTREKMIYQMDRLRGKISRAAVERSELLTRHERTLLAHFVPSGNLQEREVSGINYLGRAGYALLDRLLAQIKTQCMDHQLFVY